MTKFAQQGNRVFIAPPAYPTIDVIPPGNYSLGFDPDNIPGGYFLQIINPFTLPKKVYGHNTEYADEILSTFLERSDSITSAALAGQKGSGKTLTAKEVAIKGLEHGIPTVEVSLPFCGPGFNIWLQKIEQPLIMFVDEFEKVYHEEEKRNRLLSLLDGTFKTHKLFLFTMNKPLNNGNFEYFFNRPGRVYYNIPYGAVSEEIIKEYCTDHLVDLETRLVDVLTFAKRFTFFTLDMLTILVNEINKTGRTCNEISHIVNIKPDLEASSILFDVKVYDKDGKQMQSIFSDYGFIDAPKAVAIPFNFAKDALSRYGVISFALSTKEEYNSARELYRSDNSGCIDMDGYFDEDSDFKRLNKDDEDYAEDLKDFQDRQKEYKKKPRGYIRYRIGVEKDYVNHSQDPETRAVTMVSSAFPFTVVIEPEGKKTPKLAYTF